MISRPLRVLVALDRSPISETILAAIMPLVRLTRVDLVLLNVANPGEDMQEARTYLQRMESALALHRIRAESRVDVGEPQEAILANLKDGAIDFGAMATHGRRGVSRLLMGSIAEGVLRSAPVPMIVNRPESRIGDWKTIVVPVDGSSTAESILGDLDSLAAGSTLHLVNVAEVLAAGTGLEYAYSAVSIPDMKPYLGELAGRLAAKGMKVVTKDAIGHPATEIVRYASEVNAGLIALASHGRSGVSRAIMGSVAEQILRTSPCTVLVRPLGGILGERAPVIGAPRSAEVHR
jgi:nucleotide-binding universal stress UspA family protein